MLCSVGYSSQLLVTAHLLAQGRPWYRPTYQTLGRMGVHAWNRKWSQAIPAVWISLYTANTLMSTYTQYLCHNMYLFTCFKFCIQERTKTAVLSEISRLFVCFNMKVFVHIILYVICNLEYNAVHDYIWLHYVFFIDCGFFLQFSSTSITLKCIQFSDICRTIEDALKYIPCILCLCLKHTVKPSHSHAPPTSLLKFFCGGVSKHAGSPALDCGSRGWRKQAQLSLIFHSEFPPFKNMLLVCISSFFFLLVLLKSPSRDRCWRLAEAGSAAVVSCRSRDLKSCFLWQQKCWESLWCMSHIFSSPGHWKPFSNLYTKWY